MFFHFEPDNDFAIKCMQVSYQSVWFYSIVSIYISLFIITSGCQNVPLSLNNRVLFGNHLFTATTYYSNGYTPQTARFDSIRAWEPKTTTNADDYLQIDLGGLYKICAVATKASAKPGLTEWTKQYKLQFSSDNVDWHVYKENNIVKVVKLYNRSF
jgi:hypothetical protein